MLSKYQFPLQDLVDWKDLGSRTSGGPYFFRTSGKIFLDIALGHIILLVSDYFLNSIKMKKQPTGVRRDQIKKAFLEIISTEGLHAVSTRRLADKVGFTEGALFRHFRSKRDILLVIMEDVRKDLVEELRVIALEKRPAPERLFDFLRKHVQYLVDNKGITILLFSEAAHMNDPELKGRLREILHNLKKLVGKIIREGIAEGRWKADISVESVVTLYMGIPISLNIELVLNPHPERDSEDFCDRMMRLLEGVLEK